MSKPRAVVIVSDTHVGSTRAVCTPDFQHFEGNVVRQNDLQKWIYECWHHCWHEFVPSYFGKDKYVLVVNGDVVDGIHHKTKETMSNEVADHLDDAVKLFEPAVKRADKVFVVEGTDAHTGSREHSFGAQVGAEVNPLSGRHSFDSLYLEVAGTPGVVRHHINATTRRYLTATQYSIHMGMEVQRAAEEGMPIPKWFARAHRHVHGVFENAYGAMGITGAWQADTRWVRKVIPDNSFSPSVIIFDWRERPDGSVPVVRSHVYKSEPREYVTV